MVILITGISGVGITRSLNKYVSYVQETMPDKSIHFLKVDDEIEKIYHEENPEIEKGRQVWTSNILQQVNVVLERQWIEACKRIKTTIDEYYNDNSDSVIFVNVHAVYFHQKTQEYLSPIELTLLKTLQPSMILTLIDDIYDIHKRLTDVGGIYQGMRGTKLAIVLRYLRLLDWRSKETMMSRFFAKQLQCNNYVVAVKHAYYVFNNLVFKNTKSVYLSHPITEVRAVESKGEMSKVREIMGEIDNIYRLLSEKFTTFHPTTIDEFRIKKEGFDKHYSALTERWDKERYENPENMLFEGTGFQNRNELWEDVDSVEYDESLSSLLATLASRIATQVTVRDYTLVEQSDFLVIYRPLYNGKSSTGAFEEFQHYIRVAKSTQQRINCFVYCPQTDIDRFYIRTFNSIIQDEIDSSNLNCSDTSCVFALSQEEESYLLKSLETDAGTLDFFDDIMKDHGLTYSFATRKPDYPLSSDNKTKFQKRLINNLRSAIKPVKQYREGAEFYTEEMRPHTFYNIIQDEAVHS